MWPLVDCKQRGNEMKRLISKACMTAFLFGAAACSSSEQEQGMEEGVQGQQNEYAEQGQQNEYAEQGQQNDYGGYENSYGEEGNSYGEAGNSYGEAGNSYGEAGNSYGGETVASDAEINYTGGSDFENVAAETPAENYSADAAPAGYDNTAPSDNSYAAPAAEAPSAMPVQSGGNYPVQFVAMDGTAVYSQPDQNAAQVGTLNAGDSVVAAVEGSFARIGAGKYVMVDSLSGQIVPRSKTPNPWR